MQQPENNANYSLPISYCARWIKKLSREMYRNRDQGPRGGAEHLARIHGTEEDKVNCPFYFKIGACRHGDKCSRQHHRPPFSQTLIIQHMWGNPMIAVANSGGDLKSIDYGALQTGFDEFYEEIFDEVNKFGKPEDVQVCENLGDHMVGNVYVKYDDEENAASALLNLQGRFYAGRSLRCEFSPVTDFREARCRQYDEGNCARGPYCNFMHVREPSTELRKYLEKEFGFQGGKMIGTGSMGNLNKPAAGGGGAGRGGGGDGGARGGGGGEGDRGGGGDRRRSRSRERDHHRDGGRGGDRDGRDKERDRGGGAPEGRHREERSRDRDREHRSSGRDREHRDDGEHRSGDRDRDRERGHHHSHRDRAAGDGDRDRDRERGERGGDREEVPGYQRPIDAMAADSAQAQARY